MKKCNQCHAKRDESEFDGVNQCRRCSIKSKEYNQKNKERIKIRQKEYHQKYCKDNKWKMIQNIRKCNNKRKLKLNLNYNDIQIIGCSLEELILWIEFQFSHNMNWENYGDYWVIDHVIPKYCINDLESAERILNWKNLRPLEKEENLQKGNKLLQEEIDLHEEVYYDFLFSKE